MVRKKAERESMAKVTSKFQVTVPEEIADRYNIRPGDDIAWIASGEAIRIVPRGQGIHRERDEVKASFVRSGDGAPTQATAPEVTGRS